MSALSGAGELAMKGLPLLKGAGKFALKSLPYIGLPLMALDLMDLMGDDVSDEDILRRLQTSDAYASNAGRRHELSNLQELESVSGVLSEQAAGLNLIREGFMRDMSPSLSDLVAGREAELAQMSMTRDPMIGALARRGLL